MTTKRVRPRLSNRSNGETPDQDVGRPPPPGGGGLMDPRGPAFDCPTGREAPPQGCRDAKSGRFGKSNRFAKGRRKRTLNRQLLVEAVSPEALSAVIHALLASAKRGSVKSATLLFAYLFGRPFNSTRALAHGIDIGQLNSLEACFAAQESITKSAARGELSLEEADKLSLLIDRSRAAREAAENEDRLRALEDRLESSSGQPESF